MKKFEKKVELGGREFLVIDLTEPLRMDIEVYPGEPRPSEEIVARIEEKGFMYKKYTLGEHNFHAHCDAPSHQNPDLQHLGTEIYGLNHAFNKAALVDLSDVAESESTYGRIKYLARVEEKHLKPYEEKIADKSALIIRTGYDKYIEANKPHSPERLPHLSPEVARYIDSFDKLKVFGIDSITVDPVNVRDAHRTLKRFMIVESLVHLHGIPKKSRGNFDLQTSAIRIVGATGCPVLAYAYIAVN